MRLSFTDKKRPAPVEADIPAPINDTLALHEPLEEDPELREYLNLKSRIHRALIQKMNLATLERMSAEQLRPEIDKAVSDLLAEEGLPLNSSEKVRLTDDLIDELRGFGPLEPLLRDPTVSDILANTYREVYVERAGRIELTNVRFADNYHLLRVIERIVDRVGRRVDESQPMVDARLPDGSRVNAVVQPVALDGPLLSIRKFAKIPFNLERLVEIGSIAPPAAVLMAGMVAARLNIIVSGGTGTGKTTLMNALSRAIGDHERIVTIEDAAELQLQQRHVARLETRPPNIEGRGEITQRHLVKNALRMRPDRIIVGEVRAGEAFDMLQAMNTGHDGSITTVHANTPRDALARIEQMIGMAGIDLPTKSMRAQIASAINVVIQIKRFPDGSRRVVSIQEITGMEGDVITMQEIFRFEQTGVDANGKVLGRFLLTGVRPDFLRSFQALGIPVPAEMELA
ncbi:MAG: CpaF family protein [Hyphomonadaceae bacterium]|nr:CpaF family protein [Hyphomonadaceae bacterium]